MAEINLFSQTKIEFGRRCCACVYARTVAQPVSPLARG